MLIAEAQKLLFVHIQKTGGSSLSVALRQSLPDILDFLGTHDHARQARLVLGDQFDSYFKFAFVRNPWDRLVSWYSMIVQQSQGQPFESLNRFWQYVLDTAATFEEFVLHCTDTIDDVDGRKSLLFNQLDYLTDEQGRLLVDFVGRFETLEADARRLFQQLGLPEPRLPHRNASGHAPYRDYYSPELAEVVAQRHRRDIEYFGYLF
jgi:hypothetical protein